MDSSLSNTLAEQVELFFEENNTSCPCITSTIGCSDPTACNFLFNAAITDNTMCDYESCVGCIDPTACNYDFYATMIDNQMCEYETCAGCTNPNACNYDPNASILDSDSCDFESCAGCTEETACNYDPNASILDGDSCDLESCAGCTDEMACNYCDDCSIDDGSCEYYSCTVYGCTDTSACNYNFYATDDDNSCEYESCSGCMDIEAYNYNPLATEDDGSCIYPPWIPPVTITDCNAQVAFVPESSIMLDDNPITVGDWIGVFYTDLNGDLVCGGSIEWTGEATNMAIWGDDATTEGVKEGFEAGESYTWMAWDIETDLLITNVDVEYGIGSGVFACNALLSVYSFTGYSTIIQDIPLPEGWFMFSTYVEPDDTDMSSVISPIVNNTTIVKSYAGNVYWPIFGINTISGLSNEEGYYIKMLEDDTLSIEGQLVDSDYPINMPQGWFITSYLHQEPADAELMMSPIIDNLTILKSYSGNVYWPMFGINSIENMNPGWGYYTKTDAAVTLSYPDLESGRLGFEDVSFVSLRYSKPINTGNNMTLGIPNHVWINEPKEGDEIAVFDQNGLLVGNDKYRKGGSAVTIWGDDELTGVKDGLFVDEEFALKLLRTDEDMTETIQVHRWEEGSGSYNINGISIIGAISQDIDPVRELIKITDVLGREIKGGINGTMIYIYSDGSVEQKYLIK